MFVYKLILNFMVNSPFREKNLASAFYVNSCLGLESSPHFSYLDFAPPLKGTDGLAAMPGLIDAAAAGDLYI